MQSSDPLMIYHLQMLSIWIYPLFSPLAKSLAVGYDTTQNLIWAVTLKLEALERLYRSKGLIFL